MILLQLSNSGATNYPSDDFTINGMSVDISDNGQGGSYYIGLVRLLFWYSYYNISTEFQNNTLKYTSDGGLSWKTVTYPNGQYTISQINDTLHTAMKSNGDYYYNIQNIESYHINIIPNYSTLKVRVELSDPNFRVDFTSGDLNLLLGFEKIIVTTTQEGYKVANINRDINSLAIKCSIAQGSYNNQISDNILYTFVPSGSPGTNLDIVPNEILYLPIQNTKMITSIRISLVDQLNRRINLQGEPLSVLLSIKKFPTIK